jgi:polysaccharide export outer membrane protein
VGGLAVCLAILLPLALGAGSAPGDGPAPLALSSGELATTRPPSDYLIGVQDKLRIQVFEVKDLSFDQEQVDSGGDIVLPLVGTVHCAGLTAEQLERELAKRLGERYLQSPQVSVAVVESASQKVTVEGGVKSPGVFYLKGDTTLMQAVSMAGGPDLTANLHKVAIIRVVDGQRKAAVVDLASIERGRAPDPLINGNDVVMVNSSAVRTAWTTVLQTLPVFSLLAYLR